VKGQVWLISGSRRFPDKGLAYAALRSQFRPGDLVIHGGASGVDTWANECADALGCKIHVWPADWDKHGNSAGIMRNRQMLDDAYARGARALILWDGVSRGTRHMLDLVARVRMPMILVKADP
jgi:hypothetical protein